jgi:hypothetical protein
MGGEPFKITKTIMKLSSELNDQPADAFIEQSAGA